MTSTHLVWTGLLALLVFWAVGAYNRLMRLKNAIARTFGPLDVQLKRRHVLIAELIEAATNYPLPETDGLESVTRAHQQARSAGDAARSRPTQAKALRTLSVAEAALSNRLEALFAWVKSQAELRGDANVKALADELAGTDTTVTFARQAYNEAVRSYNSAQGEFPALLLARLFGFGPSALLQDAQRPQSLEVPGNPPTEL